MWFLQLQLRWKVFLLTRQLFSILRLPHREAMQWITQMRFYAVTHSGGNVMVDAYITALDNLEIAVKRKAGILQ